MYSYLRQLVWSLLYTKIIWQRKKDFVEMKNRIKNTVKRMFTIEFFMCMCVGGWGACVDSFCVLLCVVVYEIVCVCVMVHAPRGRVEVVPWVCVAMCSGWFCQIKKMCVLMILTKEQFYNYHCIMRKWIFWFYM